MLTPHAIRQLLAIADVRQDPYAVARVAAGLLAVDPTDRFAATHYARALAALDLGTAARRVLPNAEKEFADLLAKTPSGQIPWSSRQRRFHANLRALESRGIPVAEIAAAWQAAAAQYELHQSRDGNFHILDLQQPLFKAWQGSPLGSLEDHKATLATLPESDCRGKPANPLAFDGLGFGWLLPHLLAITTNCFISYSAPMYLVEPDPVAFCMALHLHDLQEWLKTPRLRLYLGDEARDRFLADLKSHGTWTLPARVVYNPLRSRPPLDLQKHVEPLVAQRTQRDKDRLERITAYYNTFDAAAWKKRFAEAAAAGPPLRVLGITTRYSTVLRYSMEELQTAARTVGNAQFEIAMESDDQSLEKNYLETMEQLKPDLLVTISRMRFESPDLPRNVPALCWDQDNLPCMRDPRALSDMNGLTFVAGHGTIMGVFHLNWPQEAGIFCHLAGMTHRYTPQFHQAEDAPFAADISYVSHASGSPEQLRDSLAPKWKAAPLYWPMFQAACDEILTGARAGKTWEFLELQDLARRYSPAPGAAAIPEIILSELMVDLRLLVDRTFRHQTLEWVSRWCTSHGKSLRLWGKGWENHPTLKQHAAGVAQPGAQAQAVFRASKVNLQIIETGVIHSRLLDGWSAGGFFLIRQAHRTVDEQRIRDTWRIAQLAAAENIETLGQLQSRGSDELRQLWAPLAPEYPKWSPDVAFPGYRVWRLLPPPQEIIPNLGQIMFNDEATFSTLAERYLSAPNADATRAASVASIREVLEQRLSYDARWREFISHITQHIGYKTEPAG